MNSPIRIAAIMDSIDGINPSKDSTFAMLLAAQARGWQICVGGLQDIWIRDGEAFGRLSAVTRDKGLMFVGIDVIGRFLTEINVTSPTGIRELDRLSGLNIASDLMETIESHLCEEAA